MDSEWNMKGCEWEDPQCLHSPEDLLSLIQKTGFLPLFANAVQGFSVEECTQAAGWWTDDMKADPWAWRQILASNAFVAYGKFFDRKAGFVSREWFPDFANYRRDGYDYEGLYEDGKMKYRNKKIMDAFEVDGQMRGLELLSCDLRKKSAVGKGFEGSVTELQMQTFLIINDFRQKRNRQGIGYGWHVGVLMTPETKWGYDWVNGSRSTPEEAWQRILAHLKKLFPSAEEKEIRKVMGMRSQ